MPLARCFLDLCACTRAAVAGCRPRQRRPAAKGIRSSGPVISELPRVSGPVIRGSSHGDCQPSRQAAREGATAAATMRPWRPGSAGPLSFGGVLVTATGRRMPARAGWGRVPGCQATRARRWPPSRPPAGTPLAPPSYQAHHTDEQNEQVNGVAREEQHDLYMRRVVLSTRRPRREEHKRLHACIKPGRRRHHPAGPQNWLPALGPGGPGRLGCGRPGGKAGGDCGQLRVGPRRERLAHSQVEFVLGQHAAHERGLESADHLLTLSIRHPQVSTARRGRCQLASRPCDHRRPPPSQSRGSLAPSPSWRHPRSCHDRGERADVTAGEAITARRRKPRRAPVSYRHARTLNGTMSARIYRHGSLSACVPSRRSGRPPIRRLGHRAHDESRQPFRDAPDPGSPTAVGEARLLPRPVYRSVYRDGRWPAGSCISPVLLVAAGPWPRPWCQGSRSDPRQRDWP